MGKKRFFSALLFGAMFFVHLPVAAQEAGHFDVIMSRPAMDNAKFLFVESSDAIGQLGWGAGSMINYGWQMIDVGRRGERTGSALDHVFYQHFHGTIGASNYFSAGLDIPVAWYYRFADLIDDPDAPRETHTALGDISLSLKSPLLNRETYGVGLALGSQITFPSGKAGHFLGEDNVTASVSAIVDGSPVSWVTTGLNLGYLVRKHALIAGDVDMDDQVLLQAAAAFDVRPVIQLITEVSTRTPIRSFFKTQKGSPLTVREGARWKIDDNWILEGGAEVGVIHGIGAARAGGYLGFRYVSPVKKEVPEVAPPEPRRRELPVSLPKEEVSHTLAVKEDTILFGKGLTTLTAKSQETLGKIAAAVTKDSRVMSVKFIGYQGMDEAGEISFERASQTAGFFMRRAGRPVEVYYDGIGSSQPTGSDVLDMRVDIVVIRLKQ